MEKFAVCNSIPRAYNTVMRIVIITLIFALAGDAGLTYWIYASGVSPWFCLLGIIMWLPLFILLFGVWVIILILWGLFLDKKKATEKPNHFYYGVIRQTLKWFFLLIRVKVHVRGKPLPKEPYFMVMNHRSNFDHMALIAGMKKMIICVTKPENLDFPIAGPFIHHAGFIPINRENMNEGIEAIHKASSYLEKGLCNINICPEGTRNKTEELLLPFKPGSFHIGTDVKAPVVVCCVKNADKVHKNFIRRKTHIYLDILAVIEPSEYEEMGLAKLVSYSEGLIRRDLEEGDLLLSVD